MVIPSILPWLRVISCEIITSQALIRCVALAVCVRPIISFAFFSLSLSCHHGVCSYPTVTRRRPGRPPRSRPPAETKRVNPARRGAPVQANRRRGAVPGPGRRSARRGGTESHQRPPISDGAGIPTPQVTNPAEWAIAAIVGGRKVQRWGNVGKIRMFNQHHATIVSN